MTGIPAKIGPEPEKFGSRAAVGKHRPPSTIYAVDVAYEKNSLFGTDQPPWNALEHDPAATLIKRGVERSVWGVPQAGGSMIVAKVFDRTGYVTDLFKRALRLHPAMREWRALCELNARGIPAARPIVLAYYKAIRTRPARMVLLTEGLDNAAPLTHAWDELCHAQSNSPDALRSLTSTVAALWANAHEKGYAHPDGHPGNVLVRAPKGNESAWSAYFIDPAFPGGSRFRTRPLHQHDVLRSLAMLDQRFHRASTRTQRFRFWRQYWTYREILLDHSAERRLLASLATVEQLHRATLARKWDRRLRGDRKYFGSLHLTQGWRATVVLRPERPHLGLEADYPIRTEAQWTALLSHWLASNRPQILPSEPLRFLSHSNAHPIFLHAHRLRHRDLAAPFILGCVYKRRYIGSSDGYLIVAITQPRMRP